MNKFRKALISTILCMSLVLSVVPTSFAGDWKDTTVDYCTVITKVAGTVALSMLSVAGFIVGFRIGFLGHPIFGTAANHALLQNG